MSIFLGLSLGAARFGGSAAGEAPVDAGHVVAIAPFSRDRTLFDAGGARGANAADIPVAGTTDAPDGTQIEARVVRADTGAQVHPWATIATATSGAWSGAFPLAQRSPHWLRVEVRAQGSTTTAQTANRFGVGHVWALWQQSEHHRMTSSSYSRTTVEAPAAQDMVQFIAFTREGTPEVTTARDPVHFTSQAVTDGDITASYAAMANVLMAERPGEKFAIVFQTKSGTSFLNAVDNTNDERVWTADAATHALATADGQSVGMVWSSWYNRPRNLRDQYGDAMLAFSRGKTYDGTDFVGADGAPASAPYSLTLGGDAYRFDHTARELYDTATPWVLSGPHRYDDQDGDQRNALEDAGGTVQVNLRNWQDVREDTRRLLADHPALFREGLELMSYENGYDLQASGERPFPDWGDLSHPNADSDDGLPRLARLTAHCMIYGAGLAGYEKPAFNRSYWHPDGDFAEFWFEASDGTRPDITTTRIARGEALQTTTDLDGDPMPHVTDVFGWEVNARPAARAEIVTGTEVSSRVVRVYPQSGQTRFYGSDVIAFGRGGATGKMRDPEDFYGAYWKNYPLAEVSVAGVEGVPLAALPAIANPLTVTPASLFDFNANAPDGTGGNQQPRNGYMDAGDGWAYVTGGEGRLSWNLPSVLTPGQVYTLTATVRVYRGSGGFDGPVDTGQISSDAGGRTVFLGHGSNEQLTSFSQKSDDVQILKPAGDDHAEAVVAWQFVAGTGTWVGLKSYAADSAAGEGWGRIEVRDMAIF